MLNPDMYRHSNIMQRRDATEFLEAFKSKMKWKKGANRVIDVGCGDGSVTNILMKYLPQDFKLLASDINAKMVDFANDRNRNPQTSFKVLDIGKPLPEELKGSFDYVFSSYVLHWVQNQRQAFKNIFDLLDEDGKCFTIFGASNAFHRFLRAASQSNKWSPWTQDAGEHISPYYDSLDPEKEVKQLMESIGFIDVDVQCAQKVFLFEDMNLFKRHFISVNPFKIPKELVDEFYEDFLQMMKEIEIEHDVVNSPDRIYFYYNLLHVYGRKLISTTQC